MPFVDGVRHIRRIAEESNANPAMVRNLIQDLVQRGICAVVPIFAYRNVYCVTPKINDLREDKELKSAFLKAAAADPENPPKFRDAYRFVPIDT